MEKVFLYRESIKIVGITIRTNNTRLYSCDFSTNEIALTIQKYFYNGFSERIMHRKNPGITFCVYTNYQNDFKGDFTYFVGEEVTSFEVQDKDFETLLIPEQTYAKFTNSPGSMPDVCIDMWKNIWKMNSFDLGGDRSYYADFEVYDERSYNPQLATLDIYIGLKNKN